MNDLCTSIQGVDVKFLDEYIYMYMSCPHARSLIEIVSLLMMVSCDP